MTKPAGKKHMVIPDSQVKPKQNLDHFRWAGLHAAAKQVDRIIHIGDHYDMPSLSTWDRGRLAFEGRMYTKDIEAGNKALDLFMEPIREKQAQLKEQGINWNPTLDFCLGNHEERINRQIQDNRSLQGLMGYFDFNLKQHGWRVHPYLKVIERDGIHYAHFFTSGVMGRPVSSARALLTKKHVSCVMGHVQIRDIAYAYSADGRQMTGLFVSTFYRHDEDYLTPQGNAATWRGLWMLMNVNKGSFDEVPVPMSYLEEKYKGK